MDSSSHNHITDNNHNTDNNMDNNHNMDNHNMDNHSTDSHNHNTDNSTPEIRSSMWASRRMEADIRNADEDPDRRVTSVAGVAGLLAANMI